MQQQAQREEQTQEQPVGQRTRQRTRGQYTHQKILPMGDTEPTYFPSTDNREGITALEVTSKFKTIDLSADPDLGPVKKPNDFRGLVSCAYTFSPQILSSKLPP